MEPFFEDIFSFQTTSKWMGRHFYLTYIIVASYLIGIRVTVKLMENREPFNVRKILTIWNTSLAIFSFLGSLATVPELFEVLSKRGLHHSICINSYVERKSVMFWAFLFVLSKIPELADTFFIVARKRKLIFLHYFHHAWTVMSCWHAYETAPSTARWIYTMNYSVHAVMYTYYAVSSLGYRVPKKIALLITTAQILQMIVGFVLSIYTAIVLFNNGECHVNLINLIISLIGFALLFGLFLNFFVRTYMVAPKKVTSKSK